MGEEKSPAELAKEKSNFLRGTLAEELKQPTDHFSKDNVLLTKFHGFYEQDNRDTRQDRDKKGLGREYSFMVRTKLPGGRMSAEQYLVIDDLATRFGNNTLRITTRQGFQLYGVLKKDLKTTIRTVNDALVTTLGACGDVVRNVMGCPAPTQDRNKVEIWRYAKEISDHFLSQGGAYHEIWLNGEKVTSEKKENSEPIYGKCYLPRKFKIALTFPGDNCVDAYTNDIAIVPEVKNDQLEGFNILVGGGLGFTHGQEKTHPLLAKPLCFVKPEELVKLCEAVVLVQRDFGDRKDRKHARMKYVIEAWGIEKFKTEVEKRFGKMLEKPRPIVWHEPDFHLGWHEQGDGLWYLGLSVENGRLKDDGKMKLKSGLKAIVKRFHPEVRLTAAQDVLICNIQNQDKKVLEEILTQYGISHPDRLSLVQRHSMACPALPTCGLALTEAERVFPTTIDQIEAILKEVGLEGLDVIVRMTGCPNSCARPETAELAFVGRMPGFYNIHVGSDRFGTRMNSLIFERIAEKELTKYVKLLFSIYKEKRQTKEAFGDFCHRFGIDALKHVILKN